MFRVADNIVSCISNGPSDKWRQVVVVGGRDGLEPFSQFVERVLSGDGLAAVGIHNRDRV